MLKTIGKYEILRLLGKGSMGEVYLGLDASLGREVAIKVIQSGAAFGGEEKQRFEREARAMAALNHPHIITIFDFGTVDDRHYLAMEYLEGDDLANLIQRGEHEKLQLLEALAQACEALGYVHDCGIIHRDVKPGNILVASKGKQLLAKLVDFGVASVDRSNLTEQGIWMGTVSYMAPEYLDSGKSTPSADLFAVGVIIYEILSGGLRPFPGESSTAILNAILRKSVQPLAPEDVQTVSPKVLDVMDKALAKDPADRYTTAAELARALREALREPVQPRTNGPGIRPQIVVGRGAGATCLSLRVALRQAVPGTVIVVLPGLYKEAIVVDKEVTLRGQGDLAEIVVEAPAGACLTVNAAGCAVRGLTFQCQEGEVAVDLRVGQTTLEGCLFPSLRVANGVQASLKDCNVSGSSRLPALLVETGATLKIAKTCIVNGLLGLRLQAGAQCTAEDTRFEDHAIGSLELGPRSSAHFHRCAFLRSPFAGVLALEGAQANFSNCEFGGHEGAGVHAAAGAQIQMNACRIMENPGLGVSIVDASRVTFEDCEIAANGQPGIMLHRGGTARLSHCRVVDGKSLGIACHRDSVVSLDHSLIQGNALGGILLGPEAGIPELGAENKIEDPFLR